MLEHPRDVTAGLAASAPAQCQLHGSGCGHDGRTRVHHDRLLRLEDDIDEVVDLLELAVTWQELDYSGQDVVAPDRWVDFANGHRWLDVERLFGLAADVALRGPERTGALYEQIGISCAQRDRRTRGSADAVRRAVATVRAGSEYRLRDGVHQASSPSPPERAW